VPVAALIFGETEQNEAIAGSRSPYAVAGQPLVEYQLRLAHAAGATHILLYTDRLTADVQTVLTRLERGGIRVDIVQNAADAGDRIHPDELVLIIAAGVVVAPGVSTTLVERGTPCLLTLKADAGVGRSERINAVECWAGVACVAGGLVRTTAAELGEWDFCSTLLRRAVQSNVPHECIDSTVEAAPLIAHVGDASDARAFDLGLIAGQVLPQSGMLDQFVWSPIASLLLPFLLRRGIDSCWFSAALGFLTLLTLAISFFGTWPTAPEFALLLFLSAGCVGVIARRLGSLSLHSMVRLEGLSKARIVIGGIALLFITRQMLEHGANWGYLVLSIWTVIEMVRLSQADPWFTSDHDLPMWRATPDTVAMVMIIALQAKFPLIGLGVTAAYAVVTSFILIRYKRS